MTTEWCGALIGLVKLMMKLHQGRKLFEKRDIAYYLKVRKALHLYLVLIILATIMLFIIVVDQIRILILTFNRRENSNEKPLYPLFVCYDHQQNCLLLLMKQPVLIFLSININNFKNYVCKHYLHTIKCLCLIGAFKKNAHLTWQQIAKCNILFVLWMGRMVVEAGAKEGRKGANVENSRSYNLKQLNLK